MRQCYIPKTFAPKTLRLIELINDIIDDYQAQGFRLTVRQLYYQLVARDIIPNTLQEYKRIASIINDGKLAGEIDWEAIEDRTREFVRQTRWQNGAHILQAAVNSFHKDMWVHQAYRVFVIVEKEALVGVLEPTCQALDTPLLAARGYPSGTVLREFVESDIAPCYSEGKEPVILHLGDHDPSGIDMSRDLSERISLFAGEQVEIRRIALTMDQIGEQDPPENPAKTTDARFEGYRRLYGESSWELDALSPAYLANLLRTNIERFIIRKGWDKVANEVAVTKDRITELAKDFT
jgi:hypothetical protein